MVTISCTKNGTTVVVQKAVEKEVRHFLVEHDDQYETRINGWLKDFNVDMQMCAPRIKLYRNLTEKEAANIDVEVVGQAMRDIMVSFIDFVKELMKESETSNNDDTTANTSDNDKTAKEEFFTMKKTENGYEIEGTIHPLLVISAIIHMIRETDDENK